MPNDSLVLNPESDDCFHLSYNDSCRCWQVEHGAFFAQFRDHMTAVTQREWANNAIREGNLTHRDIYRALSARSQRLHKVQNSV
jgi:hypothetical protein